MPMYVDECADIDARAFYRLGPLLRKMRRDKRMVMVTPPRLTQVDWIRLWLDVTDPRPPWAVALAARANRG